MIENVEQAAKYVLTILGILGVGAAGFYKGRSNIRKTEAADAVTVREAHGELRLIDRQDQIIEKQSKEIDELAVAAQDRSALAVRVDMLSSQLAHMERLHAERIVEFKKDLEELSQLVVAKEVALQESAARILVLERENAALRAQCAGCNKTGKVVT